MLQHKLTWVMLVGWTCKIVGIAECQNKLLYSREEIVKRLQVKF